MVKINHVDWSASDWLAGTATLTLEERGLYVTACSLIYVASGPISRADLRRVCPGSTQAFNRILMRLIEIGKLVFNDGLITQRRCNREIEKAQARIERSRENGKKIAKKPLDFSPIFETRSVDINAIPEPPCAESTMCNQRRDSDFKILQGTRGSLALPDAGRPKDTPAQVPSELRPPTEAEMADVALLVDQAAVALKGEVPKGIRDAVAYKAAVADNRFRSAYTTVNHAARLLDGKAREEAWRIVAAAEEVGSWAGMPKTDRERLGNLYKWAKEALSGERIAA